MLKSLLFSYPVYVTLWFDGGVNLNATTDFPAEPLQGNVEVTMRVKAWETPMNGQQGMRHGNIQYFNS